MTPSTRFSKEIMPAIKTIARSYIYWIGLTLGIAVLPGSILYTAGIAPRATPLFLIPLTAIALLWLDPPSSWPRSNASSLYLRLCGTALALPVLPAYSTEYVTDFRPNHLIVINLSFGLTWTLYALGLFYTRRLKRTELKDIGANLRLLTRSYATWIGMFYGIFYLPALILGSADFLLGVLLIWGSLTLGLILTLLDPPKGWESQEPSQFWIRVGATFLAPSIMYLESMLDFFMTVGLGTASNRIQGLSFLFIPWILYVLATGIAYYRQFRPPHSASRT